MYLHFALDDQLTQYNKVKSNYLEHFKMAHLPGKHRVIDSFSNPGVLLVVDCVSLFLSSFLNPQIQGVLWHPHHPFLSSAKSYHLLQVTY
jgi:hypothetical protein